MARAVIKTAITSKGRTTVREEIRRAWKTGKIVWGKCADGSARVRPAPDVMALFGAARSALPRDRKEKVRARKMMGWEDRP